MTYSLENFCDDVRAILSATDNPAGRDKVRQKLELLLDDDAFCAEYVSSDESSGLRQIYQDPGLDFCVLAYNMGDARTSPPHDHGTSWAVYGQAAGYTDMTIWDAEEGREGNIKPIRTFRLEPGQAGLFDIREIHSIQYPAGSKFVRITGTDMSKETRRVFDPETGAVREIEHIATGNAR